ncbi:sensor histidine kinase [Kineococcus sp. SYSU DK004]|uniref:sensor histidine kinase n=1 Tax=Kineococcus sp. SYSU DK004 TaxID=3383125 RepID=UPI003D7F1466
MDPGPRHALRDLPRGDAALPAALGIVASLEHVLGGYGPLWASLGSVWCACLVLAARRIAGELTSPAVAVLYLAPAAVGVPVQEPASFVLLLSLAAWSAGRHPRREALWPGAAAVSAALAVTLLGLAAIDGFDRGFDPSAMFGAVFTYPPWLLGVLLRRELRRSADLAVEAERARARHERELLEVAAVERRRLALEVHDVVSRSLAIVLVQASVAEDAVDRDPQGCRRSLRHVQDCARTAVGETGRLLRLLRDETGELGAVPRADLEALEDLVREVEGTGVPVDLVVAPEDLRRVAPEVRAGACAVAAEGLTNVVKHAPGAGAAVTLAVHGDDLAVTVTNGPPTRPPRGVGPGGHGLPGLAERVAALGGVLQHGPTAAGGHRLSAHLPVRGAGGGG